MRRLARDEREKHKDGFCNLKMFDFDEIEETVEKEGEWKEGVSVESPSKAGGCASLSTEPQSTGSVFDF
ncbi:unnamed protein product [Symbiodinium microadriaticum]|nr:unnamed protein product [Symbiodinium microadriaticum]